MEIIFNYLSIYQKNYFSLSIEKENIQWPNLTLGQVGTQTWNGYVGSFTNGSHFYIISLFFCNFKY